MEYFSEILNQPSEVDMSILEGIEQHPIDKSLDEPIKEDELNQALKSTELGKSPGRDGILPEILVRGGVRLRTLLFSIISLFWTLEEIPSDLTDPNITKLFKRETEVCVETTEAYPSLLLLERCSPISFFRDSKD